MAKRIWLDDDTEAALSRLRCNAWRYNAATKKYDRVDEDVAMVEAALQSLLQVQLAYDEAAKRDRVQLANGDWDPCIQDELVRRGYDLSTIKFSIRKKVRLT